MTLQEIKNRFDIIGNSALLNRAIDVAKQVAPTDLSVLVMGESGVGKETFPKIIHQLSARKHGKYIAVNCGAIPEGTIDSELFGHEKGSFTGAHESRKGYFEVADGGTIFLDEVAEMPMATQARLLRILENGEFMKVGSSKVLKTDVRVIAATNVNVLEAIDKGKFREDLYYRLNTVPIVVPALRERKEDIHLLFRKFSADFSSKYRMPPLKLNDEAVAILINHYWKGNIRQLKNITEQISVIEKNREITADVMLHYLPKDSSSKLPAFIESEQGKSERDLLYKVLFEMQKDVEDLKKIVVGLMQNGAEMPSDIPSENGKLAQKLLQDVASSDAQPVQLSYPAIPKIIDNRDDENSEHTEVAEETLSLQELEEDVIKKALVKHKGKRKNAAKELGISERTLYRKINEYDIRS